MEKVFIKDKQDNKVLPITHVSAVYDDEGNDLSSHLGAFEDEVRGLVDTPHQEYVTVATYASLPASGSKDTIYRVSNYDGSQSQIAADVYSEYAWDGSQYIFLCVKSQIGEVFDISAYHSNTPYIDLAAALDSNNGGGVPQSLQKGGMSVKFVQSSDNKYVQCRLMADEFTIDTTQWAIAEEGVYVENPEFIEVKTDDEGKILWAIRVDGTFYFGAGCPPQIQEYVLEHKEEIIAELNTKVDKIEGKGLSTNDYNDEAKSIVDYNQEIENPEWIDVITDKEGRILEGLKGDGTKYINKIENPDFQHLQKEVADIRNIVDVNSICRVVKLISYRTFIEYEDIEKNVGDKYIDQYGVLREITTNGNKRLTYDANTLYLWKDIMVVYNDNTLYEFDSNKHYAEFSGIILESDDKFSTRPIYPVLWGVKEVNDRTVSEGYGTVHPEPIGWLYYDKDNPADIYYSYGVADNPKKIFEWNLTVSGGYLPDNYSTVICNNGDIICVFRNESDLSAPRKNPIIYKHSDYEHPTEINVDWGTDHIKPCGWQNNMGMLYLSADNLFIFGEYTRPTVEPANVWKVTYPFDNPSNWNVVMHTTGTGEGVRQVEHFHTVDIDMYTDIIYLTSGDLESESKIWYSTDKGETWTLLLENNLAAARCANLIFTKDKGISGSDEYHWLNVIEKDDNGILDFSTLKRVQIKYPTNPQDIQDFIWGRTYQTCYVDDINSVLVLQRDDDSSGLHSISAQLYNIDADTIKCIRTIHPVSLPFNGFRCSAASRYQSACEKRFIFGFNIWSNRMDILGNKGAGEYQMNNLAIEII